MLLSGTVALSACSVVGPDFIRPQIAVSQSFAFAPSSDLVDAATQRWWTALDDPAIDDLMQQGLQANLGLKIARARIDEAAALYRAEGGVAQITGGVTSSYNTATFEGQVTESSSNTFGGTYVFDLFGRAARSRESARATLDAVAYSERDVRIAFQAELVSTVIRARFFQQVGQITERRIQTRRRILGLTRDMVTAQQLTRADMVRARAELSQLEARMPTLRDGVRRSAVQIATLLDAPVRPILDRLTATASHRPRPSDVFSAGVPANLLRNRPDILAAERQLAAAFADIGIAEANLYPSLSLSGAVDITGQGAGTFRLGPTLSVPILSRGRLIELRAATEARAVQAELAWRDTVRDAVGDVELALLDIRSNRAQINSLTRARTDFRTLTQLSRETFELGSTTLLELLDADEEVLQTEISLATAWRDLSLALARLAVSTGRGAQAGPTGPVQPFVVAAR